MISVFATLATEAQHSARTGMAVRREVKAVRIHVPADDSVTLASGLVLALLLPLLVVWIGSRHPVTVRWESEIAFGETVLDFAGPEPAAVSELVQAATPPSAVPVSEPTPTSAPALPEPVEREDVAEAGAEPAPLAKPSPPVAARQTKPRQTSAARAAAQRSIRSGGAPASGGTSGAARQNASLLRNPLPPYPAAARAAEFEGRVLLRVQVGADGRPRAATVERSCGRSDCDQAARDTVLRSWSFRPALEGGRPVEVSMTLAVKFALDA